MFKVKNIKFASKFISNFTKKIRGICVNIKFNKATKLGLLLVVVSTLLFILKSFFIAAIVNNQPVFRLNIIQELEKQSGKSVLDSIIDKKIIDIEAKARNVIVSKEDIDNEIKNIEELLKGQNLTLEQALSYRGQTTEQLREDIRVQKIIEKILADKITITEKEIVDYFNANKSVFAVNAKLDDVRTQIQSQLSQQKLSTEYQTWIEALRTKAKILYFVKY